MFIREPAELLCSLWAWIQKRRAKNSDMRLVIKPVWLAELPLDHFIQEILGEPNFSVFYALPDYVDEVDYVAEFTDANFSQFLLKIFSHCYQPETLKTDRRCASGNPGLTAYKNQQLISKKTLVLLEQNHEVRRFRERLSVSRSKIQS